jgi:hypothetical protein
MDSFLVVDQLFRTEAFASEDNSFIRHTKSISPTLQAITTTPGSSTIVIGLPAPVYQDILYKGMFGLICNNSMPDFLLLGYRLTVVSGLILLSIQVNDWY